jgi:hypothetical protein
MLKRFIISLSLLSLILPAFPILPQLSEESKVIMFTCGPGDELYSGFGHSALWVSDPALKIDRIYNYGTFDFDTPNFYGKFVMGKLDYMLSAYPSKYFINEYNSSKRSVTGQLLNLNTAEKQRIFEFLENNSLPENRFYSYDFLWDNCSTRIRDVLEKVTDGKVNFNTTDKDLTFRKMLFPYLTWTPWTKFGINLILGLTSDKKATPWDYMYLPEYMQVAFSGATIEKDGITRKLVSQEKMYLPCRLDFKNNKMDDPIVVCSLILFFTILMTLYEIRKKITFNWLNYTFFIISSLAGLFLLFMWVGTDHIATAQNMNILWLFPAQALFLIAYRLNKTVQKKLMRIALAYQFAVSFIMFVWPQETEISFMIISLIFVVRIGGFTIQNKFLKLFNQSF